MRNVYLAAIGLSAMLAMGTSANAADASASTCVSLASQVRTALASNQQSANYEAAVKESRYGRDFCANAQPRVGTAHYAQALKLLGVS
jgi:hypothetical protein